MHLLPSATLVDKIFENFSKNPYDDYKIDVDLSNLKFIVNNKFKELFKMIGNIHEKLSFLIDEYNKINQSSLRNIRDSVRGIKISCIKALDNLKEELNIKKSFNNPEIFVEFDSFYKQLGNLQNAKMKENILNFKSLNKSISTLVNDLVNHNISINNEDLNN